jgi:hypothetical protein
MKWTNNRIREKVIRTKGKDMNDRINGLEK